MKQSTLKMILTIGACVLLGILLAMIVTLNIVAMQKDVEPKKEEEPKWIDIDRQFLTKNEFSRPGEKLSEVNGIVIHYVCNPGSSAQANRDYFELLKDTKNRYASRHFIVGLEGEIIQCIPLREIAYASNSRNDDTISIECCHPDDTGEFNVFTYESTVKLAAHLCNVYNLEPKDIIRHYDVTKKECPKYFVDHKDAWKQFKKDVKEAMEEEIAFNQKQN